MSLIDKLAQALSEDAIFQSSHEVIIAEKSPEPGLKSVKIIDLPSNSLVFTFDGGANNLRNQFLQKSASDINKGCDAVIIYEEENSLCAIFCEMKSFEFRSSQYERQLINAQIFLDYLCRLVSSIEKQEIQIDKRRFVLFHLKHFGRMEKGATHAKPLPPEHKFEQMDELQYSYLHKISFKAQSGKNINNRPIEFHQLWKNQADN